MGTELTEKSLNLTLNIKRTDGDEARSTTSVRRPAPTKWQVSHGTTNREVAFPAMSGIVLPLN
jgi:hypothetical protein